MYLFWHLYLAMIAFFWGWLVSTSFNLCFWMITTVYCIFHLPLIVVMVDVYIFPINNPSFFSIFNSNPYSLFFLTFLELLMILMFYYWTFIQSFCHLEGIIWMIKECCPTLQTCTPYLDLRLFITISFSYPCILYFHPIFSRGCRWLAFSIFSLHLLAPHIYH